MALRRATRTLPKTLRLAALSSARFYASSSYDSSSSYSSSSSPSSSSSSSYSSSSPSSSSSSSSPSNEDRSTTYEAMRKTRDEMAPLTIHIKGLPPTATREKFTQALEAAGFTGVSRVTVPSNVWTQGSRGFAFVTFDSPESLAKARTLPISYEGTPLTLSGARTREESAKYKVYIGDLNYNTNDADLKTALEQFGPVEFAAVTSDGGASRGYAFATFKTIEAADAARAAGKFTLDDSVVRVEKVRQIEDRNRGDRRDSGRGRFGAERSYGDSDSYSSRGDRYSDRRGGDRDSYGSSRGGDRDSYGSRGGDRDSYGSRGGDRDSYGSRGGDRYGSSDRGSRGDRYGSSDRGSRGGDRDSYGSGRG